MTFADWVREAVGGSVLLALPVALLAGLVSFFSPCVLPLLPGYLSFATGLGAAEITSGRAGRSRVLLGTIGFVAGFAVVFVAIGALAGTVGAALVAWQRPLTIAGGILSIVLGLVFTGWLPLGQGTVRLNLSPRLGLAAAPLLGHRLRARLDAVHRPGAVGGADPRAQRGNGPARRRAGVRLRRRARPAVHRRRSRVRPVRRRSSTGSSATTAASRWPAASP